MELTQPPELPVDAIVLVIDAPTCYPAPWTVTCFAVGETVQAHVVRGTGEILGGEDVTFVSSDESVVAVSSTGKVTGLAQGEAVITARVARESLTARVLLLAWPSIGAPARLFHRDGGSLTDLRTPYGYPRTRYVLYEDGEFELHYATGGSYAGRYSSDRHGLEFVFDNCLQAVAWSCITWEATGTLDGDLMHVSYNVAAILSDFRDGTYVRIELE